MPAKTKTDPFHGQGIPFGQKIELPVSHETRRLLRFYYIHYDGLVRLCRLDGGKVKFDGESTLFCIKCHNIRKRSKPNLTSSWIITDGERYVMADYVGMDFSGSALEVIPFEETGLKPLTKSHQNQVKARIMACFQGV